MEVRTAPREADLRNDDDDTAELDDVTPTHNSPDNCPDHDNVELHDDLELHDDNLELHDHHHNGA